MLSSCFLIFVLKKIASPAVYPLLLRPDSSSVYRKWRRARTAEAEHAIVFSSPVLSGTRYSSGCATFSEGSLSLGRKSFRKHHHVVRYLSQIERRITIAHRVVRRTGGPLPRTLMVVLGVDGERERLHDMRNTRTPIILCVF